MTDLAIAIIASGTVITLAHWSRTSFSDYLRTYHPDPISEEHFLALKKLVGRHDALLKAQGMRSRD